MQISYNSYEELSVTREGRLLTITLNQPARRNTVNGAMHRELARIFSDVAMDDEADVVILTGAGDSFSAGGDIGWMQKLLEQPNGMAGMGVHWQRHRKELLDLD